MRFGAVLLLVVSCVISCTNSFQTFAPNKNILPRGKTVHASMSGTTATETTSNNKSSDTSDANVDDNSFSVVARKRVIVVGGGPVGLATALTLSQKPHYCNVTVLESAPQASSYDPTRAYLYLVNPRGQVWTRRFPDVQKLIVQEGSVSPGMGNFVIVPANPVEPVPDRVPAKNATEPSYWVSRHCMVNLLEQVIQEQQEKDEKSSQSDDACGFIELIPNQQCIGLTPLPSGKVKVTVLDRTDPEARFERSYEGDLVVGADGMNSAVRDCLADDISSPEASWLTMHHDKFRVKKWTSPASDLRMKVLQFPPGFKIPVEGKDPIQTESEVIYAIRSVNTGPRDYISLGLLPVKDPKMVRPTNVIARPNHDIWKLKTGREIREWFEKAFPRLNFGKLVPQSEWDRFAKAQGTHFPKCQYSPGLQVSHPNGQNGVVLVGDAIHAFPPDIGQGINAGLGDVEALDRALQGKNVLTGQKEMTTRSTTTLKDALTEYERVRGPEVKSLIRLARFGSPYQYRQPLYKDRVGRFLWSMNVMLRFMLSKLTRGVIPPAAIIQAMDKNITYRKLMRQADITTVSLWVCVAAVMWKTFLRGLVRTLFSK